MKILIFSFLFFVSLNVQAAVTVSSITNASNEIDLSPEDGKLIKIYAGVAGSSGACSGQSTTVDSCSVLANRDACNYKTTCSSTNLQITLTSDSKSGTVVLVDADNTQISINNGSSYTSGSSRTINVNWSAICNALGAGTNCAPSASITKTLKLGINETGDATPEDYISLEFGIYGMPTGGSGSISDSSLGGVEDYYLYPGDEKAILKEFSVFNNSFTVTGAAEIVALRAFFAVGNCTAAATPNYVNTALDSYRLELDDEDGGEKSILDKRIDEGLSNDTHYVFMIGFEDAAGNIGLFKDLQSGGCEDSTTTLTYDRHSVMPQEVYGLLEENQNCYITTAAYGSPLHSKVVDFKRFRDQVLTKFDLGKKLIRFYYKTSPPIAETIREHKALKIATQVLLWPAWAISAAVLYMGLMPFLFVVIMSILTIIFILADRKSQKTKLMIFFFAVGLATSQNALAQDDFFSTDGSTRESAPNEPPYNGTENDEFSDIENSSQQSIEAEEEYEPEIAAPTPAKSSVSGSSEKWKPYQRVPEQKRLEELADEGLIKITKKGGYEYDVQGSPQDSAASFRVGVASFPNLSNASGIYFTDVYGEDKKPLLLGDYEWQFFRSFGKLGIKIGSGLMLANGKGRFRTQVQTPTGPTDEAEEKYNFFMFPNSLSAIYRLDIFNKQWLVPYGEIGVDYLAFVEARDDGNDIKFGGAPHFHFAVGGAFLLDTLGKDMIVELDRQYGINHMWLTAEYRRLESMGGDFDFSDDLINAGIMVEF